MTKRGRDLDQRLEKGLFRSCVVTALPRNARVPQRTTRNGNGAGLPASLLGSNRVARDGGENADVFPLAEILTENASS